MLRQLNWGLIFGVGFSIAVWTLVILWLAKL